MVTVAHIRRNFHCFRGWMLQESSFIVDVVDVTRVKIQKKRQNFVSGIRFVGFKAKEGVLGDLVSLMNFAGVILFFFLYATAVHATQLNDDQHRSPNTNNKDHLVGQLTTGIESI